MKKLAVLSFLMLLAFTYQACNDDDDKQYNSVNLTSGEFSGYSYTFNPNTGFWSPVNETIRQVHLVLGGTENIITDYENKMSILFYYSGQQAIDFPSAEGQWVNFGLNIEGAVYYFQVEDAVLTIGQLEDNHFEGSLSGTYRDVNEGTRTITFSMDLRIDLQEM